MISPSWIDTTLTAVVRGRARRRTCLPVLSLRLRLPSSSDWSLAPQSRRQGLRRTASRLSVQPMPLELRRPAPRSAPLRRRTGEPTRCSVGLPRPTLPAANPPSPVRRNPGVDQPIVPAGQSISAAARPQPSELVSMGDEAFETARRLGRPVFLSVGLFHLPLAPRHGGRVLQGRADRALPQRNYESSQKYLHAGLSWRA
jgi:hypothetical protein